jgi:hypothetical protein
VWKSHPVINIARLLFPSLGRSTAAKFTRLKEPTPSSNQPKPRE